MITYNINHLKKTTIQALLMGSLIISSLIVAVLFVVFFAIEPVISYGQVETATFTVRQTITAESSFLVTPSNITMVGSINGVTGGSSTGTTQFVVQSNNTNGYYVEIDFYDNGTPEAMLGDVSTNESLRDYSGATSTPSYNFTASTSSQFAYTVTSSSTGDTDQSFLHNGSDTCNTGATVTADVCWMTPSTTAFRIVDTTAPATTGATSTVKFKIHVPSGALPVPVAETYTATVTLSLFVK